MGCVMSLSPDPSHDASVATIPKQRGTWADSVAAARAQDDLRVARYRKRKLDRERRKRAYELHVLEGRTFDEVAELLGVCNRGNVYRMVERYEMELLAGGPSGNQLAHRERMRMLGITQRLMQEYWPARSDPDVAAFIVQLQDRRCKLVGADAPQRTEITGKDGGPIAVDATLAQRNLIAFVHAHPEQREELTRLLLGDGAEVPALPAEAG